MFNKTADCSQLIVEFKFFSLFFYDKNRLHSDFLSSNECFIFFNSHLVNGPDFRVHYLNICTLLLRPHCLRWHYERVSLTSSNWRKPFFTQFEYSYFEEGCRKKCARQSQKVLWVILSSLFFKEILKNGTWGHGHVFASAKGKHHK